MNWFRSGDLRDRAFAVGIIRKALTGYSRSWVASSCCRQRNDNRPAEQSSDSTRALRLCADVHPSAMS